MEGGWSASAKVLWRFAFRFLPFLFEFAAGGLGFEFCTSVVGWRYAVLSEWPFVVVFSIADNRARLGGPEHQARLWGGSSYKAHTRVLCGVWPIFRAHQICAIPHSIRYYE